MTSRIGGTLRVVLATLALATVAQPQGLRVLRPVGGELSTAFSSIDGVRELRDGRVLVVDERDRLVRLADFRNGTVEQRGRDGGGPGEYRAPIRIFAAPGDSSIIVDRDMSRLLFADSTGHLERTQSLRSVGALQGWITRFIPRHGDTLGRLYVMGNANRVTLQGELLADSVPILRWDRQGTRLTSLAFVRMRSAADRGGAFRGPSAIPFVVGDQWAVAADGRLAIVRWDSYRVDLVSADGTRIVGPVIHVSPLPVTPAIRAEWRAQLAPGDPEPVRWPEFVPPFQEDAAIFAPNGHLWVRRTGAAGSLPLYDVFDDAAHRVFQVQLDGPGEVVGFGRAHAFIVRTDEDGMRYLRRVALP